MADLFGVTRGCESCAYRRKKWFSPDQCHRFGYSIQYVRRNRDIYCGAYFDDWERKPRNWAEKVWLKLIRRISRS